MNSQDNKKLVNKFVNNSTPKDFIHICKCNHYYEWNKKSLHKTMNINAITKANAPVMLGGHEMWGGGLCIG